MTRALLLMLAAMLVAPLARPATPAMLAAPPAAHRGPAPLQGTLFQSAAERKELDRQRERQERAGLPEAPAGPPVLSGLVSRSDGRVTVWLDGVVHYDARGMRAKRLTPADVGVPQDALRVVTPAAPQPATRQPAAPNPPAGSR